MRKYIFILFCLPLSCLGQNLVPNPSFETYSSCPVSFGQLNECSPWVDPTNSSSDLFNGCSSFSSGVGVPENMMGIGGWQYARSGNGYAGFLAYVPFSREYIQVALIDSLTTGVVYRVEFYVSLSNIEKYATDEIGAYFSSTAVSGPMSSVLSYTPQVVSPTGVYLSDTLNWMQITGTFTAIGGEKYMTIGNFKTNPLTNKIIVNPTAYDSCCAYYHIDDVQVYPDSVTSIKESDTNSSFNVYPIPSTGKIWLSANKNISKDMLINITDLAGRCVYSQSSHIGKEAIAIGLNLEEGIYFITLNESQQKASAFKKIIIHKN